MKQKKSNNHHESLRLEGQSGRFTLSARPVIKGRAAASRPRRMADIDHLGALPSCYGSGSAYLALRDPGTLYAYWDLDLANTTEGETRVLSPIRMAVYANGAASPESSVDLKSCAGFCFLPVRSPGSAYRIEVGMLDQGTGSLRVLARSRKIETCTPATRKSAPVEFVEPPTGVSLGELKQELEPEKRPEEGVMRALARVEQVGGDVRVAPSLGPGASRGFRIAPSLGSRRNRKQPRAGADSPRPADTFEAMLENRREAEWAMPRLPDSPVSSQGAAPGGIGDLAGLPSSMEMAPSSWPGSVPAPMDGFWLQVNAEVIFHGRTEPDASVWVDGLRVPLDSDGSFRFHYNFPDGRSETKVVAQSRDGAHTRSATLVFHRDSTRGPGVGIDPHPYALEMPTGFLPPSD